MADQAIAQTKVCSKCGGAKSPCSFSADKSKKDGLRTQCKACRSAIDRGYYKQNGGAIRERAMSRYEQNKSSHRVTMKRWAEKNPEKVVRSRRAWRERNRARERETARVSQAEKMRSAAYRLHRNMS